MCPIFIYWNWRYLLMSWINFLNIYRTCMRCSLAPLLLVRTMFRGWSFLVRLLAQLSRRLNSIRIQCSVSNYNTFLKWLIWLLFREASNLRIFSAALGIPRKTFDPLFTRLRNRRFAALLRAASRFLTCRDIDIFSVSTMSPLNGSPFFHVKFKTWQFLLKVAS